MSPPRVREDALLVSDGLSVNIWDDASHPLITANNLRAPVIPSAKPWHRVLVPSLAANARRLRLWKRVDARGSTLGLPSHDYRAAMAELESQGQSARKRSKTARHVPGHGSVESVSPTDLAVGKVVPVASGVGALVQPEFEFGRKPAVFATTAWVPSKRDSARKLVATADVELPVVGGGLEMVDAPAVADSEEPVKRKTRRASRRLSLPADETVEEILTIPQPEPLPQPTQQLVQRRTVLSKTDLQKLLSLCASSHGTWLSPEARDLKDALFGFLHHNAGYESRDNVCLDIYLSPQRVISMPYKTIVQVFSGSFTLGRSLSPSANFFPAMQKVRTTKTLRLTAAPHSMDDLNTASGTEETATCNVQEVEDMQELATVTGEIQDGKEDASIRPEDEATTAKVAVAELPVTSDAEREQDENEIIDASPLTDAEVEATGVGSKQAEAEETEAPVEATEADAVDIVMADGTSPEIDTPQEDSEAELLRRFVTRVNADKSAKTADATATTLQRRKLAPLRGSEAKLFPTFTTGSPAPATSSRGRLPLDERSCNSPSPRKRSKSDVDHIFRDNPILASEEFSPRARPKRRRTRLDAELETSLEEDMTNSGQGAADDSGPRRSRRIRSTVPPPANPSAVSLIPVRLSGQASLQGNVNLESNLLALKTRCEGRDLAAVTRMNTRKNKGSAVPACVVLARQAEEPSSKESDDMHDKKDKKESTEGKKRKQHRVRWDNVLARYQDSPTADGDGSSKPVAVVDASVPTDQKPAKSTRHTKVPIPKSQKAEDTTAHVEFDVDASAQAAKDAAVLTRATTARRAKFASLGRSVNGTPAPKRRRALI